MSPVPLRDPTRTEDSSPISLPAADPPTTRAMPRAKSGHPAMGDIDAQTASRLLGASSDIALVLDTEGKILDVMAQAKELGEQVVRKWRGRMWAQTVTPESREKVEALLEEARQAAEAARWRQVTHPVPDGEGIPVLYSAIRVSDAGPGGGRLRRARPLSHDLGPRARRASRRPPALRRTGLDPGPAGLGGGTGLGAGGQRRLS